MSATHSDLIFVGNGGGGQCGCGCSQIATPIVFRSVWDRLCRQLFEAMPPDMASEDQLPDIDIWKDGVALADDSYPYTFVVASDGTEAPKQGDVIEYKNRYYIVGGVKPVEEEQTEE